MLQQYSVKSDLWSVGIIMYESLVGATPFAVKSPLELINMIDRKPLYIPEKELGLSKDCVNLLENLLQVKYKYLYNSTMLTIYCNYYIILIIYNYDSNYYRRTL